MNHIALALFLKSVLLAASWTSYCHTSAVGKCAVPWKSWTSI